MRVVDDALDALTGAVGKRDITERAVHLVAPRDAVDGHAATGAGPAVVQDRFDAGNDVGVAGVFLALELATG